MTSRSIPTALFAALLALGAASGAGAQAPSSAAHTAAHARLGVDTPIEVLAANPAAAAVVEEHLPGLLHHEHYPMFKTMSLREIAPMTNGALTDAALAAIDAELAAIT